MTASWNFAKRPFRDDRPAYGGAVALFLAGAVLLVVNLRLFTSDRRAVADTRAEIAALEARQRDADAKGREAKTALSSYKLSALAEQSRELARVVAERKFSWIGLLARLERTLPSDVGIQRLQPEFGKDAHIALTLQLVGRSREAVVPTIAALTKDPAFTGVELRTESQPEGGGADPFTFFIASRYEPEAVAEANRPGAKGASRTDAKKPAAPAGSKPGRAAGKNPAGAGSAPRPGSPAKAAPMPRPVGPGARMVPTPKAKGRP